MAIVVFFCHLVRSFVIQQMFVVIIFQFAVIFGFWFQFKFWRISTAPEGCEHLENLNSIYFLLFKVKNTEQSIEF